jgi:signal transduction histidine kinase/ActR/RegA family two-component response regulator
MRDGLNTAGNSAEYLRAYAGRYRDMFAIRLATIAAVSLLAVWLLGWSWGANFALCQLALYALLWREVQIVERRADAPSAHRRLSTSTELITLGLATHNALFALAVWLEHPELAPHIALLLAGNLMVGALQVHVSRLGFAAAVVPPSVAMLSMVTTIAPDNTGLQMSVVAFLLAMIGAAWRQWITDRQTVDMAVAATGRTAELQAALAEAEAARICADKASAAKSRFLAMISHEVRTPLNVMLGLTEVMKGRPRPAEEAAIVSDMGEAGDMLLRLLNDALDLSKIESGKAEVHAAPVDLGERLDAIARVWRSRADEMGLSLELERHGAAEDFLVHTDQARIERILINYLSNALKLTAAGVVRLTAQAGRRDDGKVDLTFEVHDQGPGIPAGQHDRVFQPFEQLEAGRKAGGTGLGLALCRAAAEALGGEIGVRDAQPHGAIFWLRLTADRAVRTEAADAALPSRDHDGPNVPPLRILAAEDHPANRKLLGLLLTTLGQELVVVENGAEAVEILRREVFDLVLMDVMMPVMDGVTALAAIRAEEAAEDRPRARIHMLTANVFDEDVARYRAAGADGVLRKPIEIASLQATLVEAAGAATLPPLPERQVA